MLPPAAIAYLEHLLASYDQDIAAARARGATDEATLLGRRQRILARVLRDAAATSAASRPDLVSAGSARS